MTRLAGEDGGALAEVLRSELDLAENPPCGDVNLPLPRSALWLRDEVRALIELWLFRTFPEQAQSLKSSRKQLRVNCFDERYKIGIKSLPI